MGESPVRLEKFPLTETVLNPAKDSPFLYKRSVLLSTRATPNKFCQASGADSNRIILESDTGLAQVLTSGLRMVSNWFAGCC
jgi:hypothetical protein